MASAVAKPLVLVEQPASNTAAADTVAIYRIDWLSFTVSPPTWPFVQRRAEMCCVAGLQSKRKENEMLDLSVGSRAYSSKGAIIAALLEGSVPFLIRSIGSVTTYPR